MSHAVNAEPRERVAYRCICCGQENLHKSPAILMPFIAHRVFDWQPIEITEAWGLRTIANGHAHAVCNSLYCPACDFLFLDLRFSDAEMARLYADYRGEAYVTLRERYEPGYRERNARLIAGEPYLAEVEAFIQPWIPREPIVLDWGGDAGRNSPFRDRCRRLDVLDISNNPTLPGIERVDQESARRRCYDVIVCSQVLEHVPYPGEVLQDLRRCMQAHTVLYVEVPRETLMQDEHSADIVSRKRHWHEHINFFSGTSLDVMLRRSGFAPITIQVADIATETGTAQHFRVLARPIHE